MREPRVVNGVPFCSEEACQQYDGKRCRELGQRPGTICEPEVIDMTALIVQLQKRIRSYASP